jgi:hypothetical protein
VDLLSPPPSPLRGMPHHHHHHQGGQSPQKNGTSCNMLMMVGRGRYIITNITIITIGGNPNVVVVVGWCAVWLLRMTLMLIILSGDAYPKRHLCNNPLTISN